MHLWAPVNRDDTELMLSREDENGTVHYVYDAKNLFRELDETFDVECAYTLNPMPYGDLVSQRQGSDSYFHLFDVLGSTRQLTDGSQTTTDEYIYGAYGKTLAHTGTTQNVAQWIGKSGYVKDEATDRTIARRREIESELIQFTSQDPAQSDPNAYRYADNNPVRFVDPSGLESCQRACTESQLSAEEILEKQNEKAQRFGNLVLLRKELAELSWWASDERRLQLEEQIAKELEAIRRIDKEIGALGSMERMLLHVDEGLGDSIQALDAPARLFLVLEHAYKTGKFTGIVKERVEALLQLKDNPQAMAAFLAFVAANRFLQKQLKSKGTTFVAKRICPWGAVVITPGARASK